ncbi:hypothetical protein SPSSI1_10640 [Streptococcus pseudopneumoniae]|nr:hypothetical protein SPSSI1_10640 [Streptococcus pseudopneumoniae]
MLRPTLTQLSNMSVSVLSASLYSMKIKGQTKKLAAGCSKQWFEVVDRTDEVGNIYTVRRR